MTNLWLFFHNLDQFLCNFFRITIKNPDPTKSADFTKCLQKLWKRFLTVNIFTVYCCFLCHQNQFFYALFCQIFCLFYKALHWNTAIISTYFGNNTVSTVLITTFCNLHVSIMTTGCHNPLFIYKRKCIHVVNDQLVFSMKRSCNCF